MILGISGASGSGKTTIARIICQFLAASSGQKVQIIHQDDFYKPEKDIPMKMTRAGNVVNWDCEEAIDIDDFVKTLTMFRDHGCFPDKVQEDLLKRSKEDQNEDRSSDSSNKVLKQIRGSGKLLHLQEELLIVDGFMLYSNQALKQLIDIPILLRGSFAMLKERRESRSGYVTLEGFWKDPQHYFEDVVWPEYVASHAKFFRHGQVEGSLKDGCDLIVSEHVDMDLELSTTFVLNALTDCCTHD